MNSIASTLFRSGLLLIASAALRAEDTVPIAQFNQPSSAGAADLPALETGAILQPRAGNSDYLFPRKGHGMVTALTGIPYVGIVEYAHGFTDRFAVGFFAGTITTEIQGYGVRLRYIVAQPNRDFRVHVKVPLIYYPASPGLKPWLLAWPNVSAEWRRESGVRLWTGIGLVATNGGLTQGGGYGAGNGATTTSTTKRSSYGSGYTSNTGSHSYGAGTSSTATGASFSKMGDSSEGGVWNTFQLGFSKPVTRRLTFQFEAASVLKGVKLSSSDRWIGGPPVIVTTGLSYAF